MVDLSVVRQGGEVSSTVSWALSGKSGHALCRS